MACNMRMPTLRMLMHVLWSTIGIVSSQESPGILEYCEDEIFSARCSSADEVLIITHARYGRMALGRCVTRDYGSVGCSVDVTSVLDRMCSGQHSCETQVSQLMHSDQKPCPRDFRSYLEAAYACVPVVYPTTGSCLASNPLDVNQPAGYLASSVTEKTGCGGIDAPWRINLPAGSQINFTLWDFDLPHDEPGNQGLGTGLPSPCHVYAIIKEKETMTSSRTVCSSGRRVTQVYSSIGSSAEVRIVTKRREEEQGGNFMLQYNTMGCADIIPSEGSSFTRTANVGHISCQLTDERWDVVCRDNAWRGKPGNCSKVPGIGGVSVNSWGGVTGSQGVSIAIIAGVAIVVGMCIVVFGLFLLKWRRNKPLHSSPDRQGPISYAHTSMNYCQGAGKMKGPPGMCDPYETAENNYYRTWQLQQRQHKPREPRDVGISPPQMITGPPAPYYQQTGSSDPPGHHYYPVEHIYESPKFLRRQLEVDPLRCQQDDREGRDPATESRQYFELDPDHVDHQIPIDGQLQGAMPCIGQSQERNMEVMNIDPRRMRPLPDPMAVHR